MGNTTKYFARHSGTIQNPVTRYAHHSGSWQAIMGRWAHHSGSWQLTYSTPTVSVTNTGSVTGSGASTSGTTSGSVTATPGGYRSASLAYSYAYVSGDTGFTISSGNGTPTPTFSRAFSGVANGTTSGAASGVWQCTITDTTTGATNAFNFNVGPFYWQNTIPAYGPFTISAPNSTPSASSPTGTTRTLSTNVEVHTTVSVTGGGPTSGSYSYSWSNIRLDGAGGTSVNGATNTAVLSCQFAFSIPSQTTTSRSVLADVTVTDTVSGYSTTQTNVLLEWTYTNNYG